MSSHTSSEGLLRPLETNMEATIDNLELNPELNKELSTHIDTKNRTHQEKIEESIHKESNSRLTKDNSKYTLRGDWSSSKIGQRFVSAAHKQFFNALVSFLEPKRMEKGGRGVRAAQKLRDTGIEPEVLSYLYVKQVYNLIPLFASKPIKRSSFCIRSVDAIHNEYRLRDFGSTDNRKALLKKITKDMEKRSYPEHWRLRTYRMYFDAEKVDWRKWSQRECLSLGFNLMNLFMEATGLIQYDESDTYIIPNPSLVDHIEEVCKRSITDFTLYLPMVSKPRPWSHEFNLFKGGYLNKGLVKPYSIIKGSGKRDIDRMLQMDWSKVIPAINAIQEVPWRVKPRMVEALDYVFNDIGGNTCGLPHSDPIELPPVPPHYDSDEAVKKAHNRHLFLLRDQNRQDISKRIAIVYTLHLAKRFKQFKRLWMPHSLDVRGRAYPVPAFLNPQAADYGKSMLEFANGVVIETMEQAAWLAIAGANAWGNDKVSLQDRADWVVANEEWICECGADWKANTKWMEADEPFMFLSFCMEWADFLDTNKRGEAFYSHFPCHVDATCSGLQHYSGMLRDPVGGKSVNLVAGYDRQDIYGDVAKKTLEILAASNEAIGRHWIDFGVDRKMTKRQTMVIPYAGKFSSCMEYTRVSYQDKMKAGHARLWPEKEDQEHITFLSKAIWQAIAEVVIKGKEAMDWLSGAASAWSKYQNVLSSKGYDKRMTWVTPDGFEVVQYRPKSKKAQVDTFFNGRVSLVLHEEQHNLEAKDMALSCPPNFVHSLDANHLRACTNKALDIGITDFAMIHDSFGVHAAHMPRFLEECVKPAFVDMYELNDPLMQLHERLPFEHPLPPQKGTLNIRGVLDSEFFFS